MPSRMSDEKRAKQKAQAQTAASLRSLAVAANGHEVSRADRDRAQTALVGAVGKRRAKALQETEMLRAGARPKGLRRWLG